MRNLDFFGNGERMRKWRGNGDKMRKWRQNKKRKKKGYKFISSRKQEKYAKANCMTTEAHFLETMKKLDFKQCAERQYQQTLVAKNLC